MAARKDSRIKTKHRQAIQTTMIIKRLTKHIDGKVDMSSTQVTAALGLLKKALPDLKAMEHSGEIGYRPADELSNDELERRIADLSEGIESEKRGKGEFTQVH